MALAGVISLGLAFVAIVISIGAFLIGRIISSSADGATYVRLAGRVGTVGRLGVIITALALSFGCGLLVFCFLSGDVSLEYVVRQHSDSTGPLSLLYRISGLWGGQEGSLLFWAWLIGLFGAVMALRNLKKREELDDTALLVLQFVLLFFVALLLFSEQSMPFMPLDSHYLDASGQLKSFMQLLQESSFLPQGMLEPTLVLGMNPLLEHWAMAIHPPTLFAGYAGLTVPFAYAIAALIVNDPSRRWVERSQRYALISWVFLGLGIGLGALWAYVVLGWGGYWGWDPVENASLLPWLIAVALIHSFTVYRQRGGFRIWTVACACLAFVFVIISTFITRSGIVSNSVHTFAGDAVTLYLFLGLIVVSLLTGVLGLIIRRKTFGSAAIGAGDGDRGDSGTGTSDSGSDGDGGTSDSMGESLLSREAAYYFNNVIIVLSAIVILYLTLASALPSWMPLGGLSSMSVTCNAIARPIGILYCLLMAVCPMLSWAKADGRAFWKKARIPGICALVLFALLLVYFFVDLKPSYDAALAAGGTQAESKLEGGQPFYYFLITLGGFFVASLLLMNSLFMLGRVIGSQAKAKGVNPVLGLLLSLRNRASAFGGFLAHLSMGIILIGLIGSSMYVSTATSYLPFDEESNTAGGDFTIRDYRLSFVDSSIELQENGTDRLYTVIFDAYKDDRYLGRVSPGVYLDGMTQQPNYLAGVLSLPLEDLFVVYNGVNSNGDLSIGAFVNPCISFVWVGFALLMVATVIATLGRRQPKPQQAPGVGKGSGAEVVPDAAAAPGVSGGRIS
ncbi:MAG: cytochrome c biogenesis protein CcsA [Coriobacteriales bacterium]|jgi:cytochrome c-type biogenesis protein CcmF|nr:cytochrome c biogenesis protein CcsA [Coriobacteriales bacterium]